MLGSDLLSPSHLLLVLLVVFFVFGPKKLPELARGLGSAMREFRGGISASGNPQEPAATLEPSTAIADTNDQSESIQNRLLHE